MTDNCDNDFLDTGYVEGSGMEDTTQPSVWLTSYYTHPDDTTQRDTIVDTLRHGREITNISGTGVHDPNPCDTSVHGTWIDSVWSPVPTSSNTVVLAATPEDTAYLIKVPVPEHVRTFRLDSIHVASNYQGQLGTVYHQTCTSEVPPQCWDECGTTSGGVQRDVHILAVTVKRYPEAY